MKTLFRASILGLVMIAMVGATSQIAFAQEDEKTKIYNRYMENYQGDLAQRKIALAAAELFVKNYSSDQLNKEIIDYFNGVIPGLREAIVVDEKAAAEAEAARIKAEARAKRLGNFDKAYKAEDIAGIFRTGQLILDAEPNLVDVSLVLAGVGYDEAIKEKDVFNDKAIQYAEMSIRLLENKKVDTTFGEWGGYDYVFKTKNNADGRNNALGYMHYYIGYIKRFRQQKTEEAVPHFFKSTKFNSMANTIPDVYSAIGGWYITKITSLTKERNAILEERNAETKVEEPSMEKIAMFDAQIDGKIAMEKGYADRAIDAYSRAYSHVPVKDRSTGYGKSLFTKLQALHKLRYHDKPEMQSDVSINTNVSMVKAKSMPDPATAVQPIGLVKPVDTATDASTTKTTITGASRTRTVKTSANN
jgi:hypothetical protein